MSAAELKAKVDRMSAYHCEGCTNPCTDACAAYRVITRALDELRVLREEEKEG